MKRIASVALATLVLAGGCSSSASTGAAESVADVTIVLNAQVYTVDADRSWAEAFAYDSLGVIIAVGSEDSVRDAVGDSARIIDAQGNMVLPGFQDAHVHVPEAGINLEVCFMPSGLGLDDYAELVSECAAENPDDEWVRAAGATLFELRSTAESPLAALDAAVPDRPVVVLDDLGHAVWTNSLGLELAGITADAVDPTGGVFHRDRDGQLTGLLLEDAQQLVRNAAAPDDETNYRGLLAALDELAKVGVTTISDAGGYWGQNHPAAWERAGAEGTLTVRAFNSLYVYPDLDIDDQLQQFEDRFRSSPDSMLKFDTAKVYVDGIIDLGTAAMLEPYDVPVDPLYPDGFEYFPGDGLISYVTELHTIGYRINFHAVGDRAVRQALDAVESIQGDPRLIAERRHRITHTYLVDDADVPRFAEIGVIADFQQSADSLDPDYHEFLSEFIGDRAFDLIPTAVLLEAGASVSLSSDWDAGPLPPLGTIERLLTRETNGIDDLAQAISLATIDSAYALGHDDVTGSIEVGKYADFVIVDQNLFEVFVDDLDETEVLLTVVAGRTVYGSVPG